MKLKVVGAGLLLVALGLGMVYRDAFLVACGDYLISDGALDKAGAILVLSGGVPERMLEAVDLYKEGYAPRIVITKAEEPENQNLLRALGVVDPEVHEVNLQIAAKLDIPDSAITVLEPRVNSTYRELEVLRDYCLAQGIQSVILVTSKPHTTRSYKIFQHLAEGRIKAISRPSRYDTFNSQSWWKDRGMAKEVFYEYQKLVNFYLVER